jgi:hypothetical protein
MSNQAPGDDAGAVRPPASAANRDAAGGEPAGAAADPRVAEVLQQLRSGVRLRRAEAAVAAGLVGGDSGSGGDPGGAGAAASAGAAGAMGAMGAGGGGAGFAQGLLAVRSAEYVQEPVAFSHRPRFGSLIVGARKAFFHLFLKWFMRPVLAQQNAFNQAAGRLLQELAEASQRTARETRLLAARVAELEARTAAAAASAAAAATAPSPDPGAAARAAQSAAESSSSSQSPPPSPAAGEGPPVP